MALSQADRIAFSLNIVSADPQIANIEEAKGLISDEIAATQALDTANKNLFDPVNVWVNKYQKEFNLLDGNLRTEILEQNIQDSANRVIGNYFFPNDTLTTVPSLAAFDNVWPQTIPFALTQAIGKNSSESYTIIQKEGDLIAAAIGYITAAGAFMDIENTTGQRCVSTGTCSNPIYTDQTSCTLNGGIWTPGPDSIQSYPAVQTLKTNLVNTINALITFVNNEAAQVVTDDMNAGRQADNNAAINDINNVLIPALNTWLGYSDFNTAHGQSTCVGFYGYNSNLLAPTKLHSTQLAFLLSTLNTRLAYITTRIAQLNAVLGTITQDVNTGAILTSSGFYGQRFSFLLLRLNTFGGTLIKLTGLLSAIDAQDQMEAAILQAKNTYLTVISASALTAPTNGTNIVHAIVPTYFSAGDTVYIFAEDQIELQRAVKSVNGTMITLNDTVPAKYRQDSNARIYKDLT